MRLPRADCWTRIERGGGGKLWVAAAVYFINFSTLENVIYISCDGEKKTLAQHERLQIVRTAQKEAKTNRSRLRVGERVGKKKGHKKCAQLLHLM